MRTSSIALRLMLACQACFHTSANAEDTKCGVPVFRGATQPQGGHAEMRVVNNGQACGIRNYGSYPNDATLAFAGEITVLPENGQAKFIPPRAVYTPKPGFSGEDSFEYRATAKGPSDNLVYLRVKVKVLVVAE